MRGFPVYFWRFLFAFAVKLFPVICCYIDGKDKHFLKLEQIGSTFSHYDAMLANLNISASWWNLFDIFFNNATEAFYCMG